MPPAADNLTVRLVGPENHGGAVYLATLGEFCTSLQQCLRRAEASVYGTPGMLKYSVAELHSGSAQLTIEAVRRKPGRDKRKAVFKLVKDTVRQIQAGRRVSSRVTREDIEAYKKLASVLNRGAQEIWVDGILITHRFITNADTITLGAIPTKGSVSGVLEKINIHNNRNEFVLFPPVTGCPISCLFPGTLLEDVRRSLKATVTVTGTLEYEDDNPFPKRVHIEAIEAHPAEDELPSIFDLRGSAKGCTGELSADAFVAALRNE